MVVVVEKGRLEPAAFARVSRTFEAASAARRSPSVLVFIKKP